MKKTTVVTLAIFLVFGLLMTPSFAAQGTTGSTAASNQGTAGKAAISGAMAQGSMRLSQMVDKTVKDKDGNDLGQIEDFIADNQGNVRYGILAGPYNKYYPIPLQTLVRNLKGDDFVLNISKDRLENAPSFPRDEWPAELNGQQWEQKVFGYYDNLSSSGMGTQPKGQ